MNDKSIPEEPLLEDMLYRPVREPLDTAASIFDKGQQEKTGGINTAGSVFDTKALFHVPQPPL